LKGRENARTGERRGVEWMKVGRRKEYLDVVVHSLSITMAVNQ
jgi:hypothetical protein